MRVVRTIGAMAFVLFGTSGWAQTLSPPAVGVFALTSLVGAGISQLTDFRFLPDGRVVITQKTGEVFVRRTDGTLVAAGAFTVDSDSEKGLLGVEVHPQFASNGLLFFYYSGGPSVDDKHRVSTVRLGADGLLDMASEVVLLHDLRGPANHDGGGLAIGPDGKLYVGVGDTGCNSGMPPGGTITNYTATCLTTGNGKILRIDLDGSIPADNPLVGAAVPDCDGMCTGNPAGLPLTGVPRTEVWAWGLRNPFRFGFDPQTGSLWVADVGEVTYEELNLVTKGQHFGWPYREGAFGYPPSTCRAVGPGGAGSDCVEPKYFCRHGSAQGGIDGDCQSITGGVFVDAAGWPAGFRGLYWFGDNANGRVWTLQPNPARDGFVPGTRQQVGDFGVPVRFLVGPDENLYVGVLTGKILRIAPIPGGGTGAPANGGGCSAAAGSGGLLALAAVTWSLSVWRRRRERRHA